MKNKQGGIDPKDKAGLKRAENADLVTLPKNIEGTNCSNCKFVKILDKEKGIGYCTHKQVLLPVTSRMCCALWDAVKALRAWKK